ncbi:DUF2357 domain-containing protein [Thermococcus sp. 21S7]|uniref:DUF2357 domain-containing protein n=1 Tax=Thermococcus sp. 21S7 TaxID=1638221 RepID=UPI003211DA9B
MECIEGDVITSTKSGCWAFSDDERWYLFEWVDYLIRIDADEVFIGKAKARKLKNGSFLVSIGNFIGDTEVVGIKNGEICFKRPAKVLSIKLSKMYPKRFSSLDGHWVERLAEVQDSFIESLTGDVVRYSISMPFQLESPTAFTVMESDEPINELFAYHYLRTNGERIIGAFETVTHRMKRELVVEEEWMRPHEIDEVTPETLLSIAQHPEYLAPAGGDVLLRKHLDGYIPTRVMGFRRYESADTKENRFVKYFLNMLVEWSERVVEAFENNPPAELNSIKELLKELEFIKSDGVWEDVGEMTLFPYTSQTLLKGDGYRDLLELYREFTSYVPFFEEVKRAVDSRDVAKLYEYWAFFRLVEELGEVLGEKRLRIVVTLAGEISERGDVYAQFDNGWRLYYNKRLTPGKWSYSVTLRPDFSLFTGNPSSRGTRLVGVFDAKFKLDAVDENREIENFDELDENAEKTGRYETWAKLEDIYKMHTYRDALGCRFAVVVYPGRKSVFFDAKTGKHEDISLESAILDGIEGVGYLSFVPGVME